jgi:aspartyl protease family protein
MLGRLYPRHALPAPERLRVSQNATMINRTLLAVVLSLLAVCLASAAELEHVRLLALMHGKAILSIEGARRVLKAGETSPEGLTLVDATTESAVIEINGRRETLHLGSVYMPGEGGGPPAVTLWADRDGFFFVNGAVNGRGVRFLVDTGADTVAFSSRDADSVRLDYRRGDPALVRTASGVARAWAVKLDRLEIGEIVLYNVDASVIEGAFPDVPLLGMSVLHRLEMSRHGRRMDLVQSH